MLARIENSAIETAIDVLIFLVKVAGVVLLAFGVCWFMLWLRKK